MYFRISKRTIKHIHFGLFVFERMISWLDDEKRFGSNISILALKVGLFTNKLKITSFGYHAMFSRCKWYKDIIKVIISIYATQGLKSAPNNISL